MMPSSLNFKAFFCIAMNNKTTSSGLVVMCSDTQLMTNAPGFNELGVIGCNIELGVIYIYIVKWLNGKHLLRAIIQSAKIDLEAQIHLPSRNWVQIRQPLKDSRLGESRACRAPPGVEPSISRLRVR